MDPANEAELLELLGRLVKAVEGIDDTLSDMNERGIPIYGHMPDDD